MEAVLGAVFLDAGLEPARALILQRIVLPELEEFVSTGRAAKVTDYKSALQETLQATARPQPAYVLVKESGPEHQKTFTIEARLPLALGSGQVEFVGRAGRPHQREKRRAGSRPASAGASCFRQWSSALNLVRKHAERRSGWPESLQSLLGTVVIAVFVVSFIVQAFQIPSESMENTLLTGDYLLVDKVHFGNDAALGAIFCHIGKLNVATLWCSITRCIPASIS